MPALHTSSNAASQKLTDVICAYEGTVAEIGGNGYEGTIRALDDFAKLGAAKGFDQLKVEPAESLHWYTRFASALLSWAFRDETDLDPTQLAQLCLRKRTVVSVFDASGFCGTAVILAVAPKKIDRGSGEITVRGKHLKTSAAMTSINSVPKALLDYVMGLSPEIYFPFMLGWLNERAITTQLGEENRTKILRSVVKVEGLSYSGSGYMNATNTAWMYCSYASTPDKHEFKKSLNTLIERYASSQVGPLPKVSLVRVKKQKTKPKLLVINEYLHSRHAMFRCYEKAIRSLDDYFELIGACDRSTIDETGRALFSRVILFHKDSTLKEVVNLIVAERPDVIYYPSVGMSPYITCLANLRLAPIQVAGQGHPATTKSKYIDYVVVSSMEGDLTQVYSEQVLIWQPVEGEPIFTPSADLAKYKTKDARRDPTKTTIAVNSKVFKLNHRLLDICKKLSRLAESELSFRFFTGESGVLHDGLRRHITDQILNSDVYPELPYSELLSKMMECDFCMAAFPFGNTNGTVDACLLGLPTVAHFGPEYPAQSDKIVLELAGYPIETVAKTDEEYFDIALRLVRSPDYRAALRNRFPPLSEVYERFYGLSGRVSKSSFGDLVHGVYTGRSEAGVNFTRKVKAKAA